MPHTYFYVRGVPVDLIARLGDQLDLDLVQVGLHQEPELIILAADFVALLPSHLRARTILVEDDPRCETCLWCPDTGCTICNSSDLSSAITHVLAARLSSPA